MRVAIIGGDRRMLYAAIEFLREGDTVFVAGFDETELLEGLSVSSAAAASAAADIIVLPVRPLTHGVISTPLSEQKIPPKELSAWIGDKPVFSGFAESLRPYFDGRLFDYTKREDFNIRNAVLTAEGVIGLLVAESPDSVFGSRILVLGYGRIGRILSGLLRDMGAEVTVAARREAARAGVRAAGMQSCDFDLRNPDNYCFVINTVPSPVLAESHIKRLSADTVIIDLASAPGGVDKKAAEAHGIRCIHALALPGRTAPAAAGRIIKDTIRNIMKEENGG